MYTLWSHFTHRIVLSFNDVEIWKNNMYRTLNKLWFDNGFYNIKNKLIAGVMLAANCMLHAYTCSMHLETGILLFSDVYMSTSPLKHSWAKHVKASHSESSSIQRSGSLRIKCSRTVTAIVTRHDINTVPLSRLEPMTRESATHGRRKHNTLLLSRSWLILVTSTVSTVN